MDPQPERPILLEEAPEVPKARSMNGYLQAALIAVAIHLTYFAVIDYLTIRHISIVALVAILPIRLIQAPLAALAGVAVYGTWRFLRFLGTKLRRSRHLA
jgi:hypothetical protein